MSQLIVSILEPDAAAAIQRAGEALTAGADLVEIRLDRLQGLTPSTIPSLASALPKDRWIATCRSREQGGYCDRSAADRLEILKAAASSGASYVDVEWHPDGVDESLSVLRAANPAIRIILSHHDLQGIPDVAALREGMESAGGPTAILKVAWKCNDINDNLSAVELLRSSGQNRGIAIGMGEKGVFSRILAGKFGAFGSFSAPTGGTVAAPGQLTLPEMIEDYRWKELGPETQVFGVIGNPVSHSMSPAIFNSQFAAAGYDGVYLPLLIENGEELLRFLEGCRVRPWMGIRGFSITVPHKSRLLSWPAARANPLVRRIGAANTVVFADDEVRLHNTDYAGALEALLAGMDAEARDLRDIPVAVLGAGGVARAVITALCDQGCRITIFNRSPQRAQSLAAEMECVARPWEERGRAEAKVIVNCTSVGMKPATEESPFPCASLRQDMTVFDTVYNPPRTRLLREAESAGCGVVDGVSMFVRQAATQYRLWTGKEPDLNRMTHCVTQRLSAPDAD